MKRAIRIFTITGILLLQACQFVSEISTTNDDTQKVDHQYSFLLGNYSDSGVNLLRLTPSKNTLIDEGIVAHIAKPSYLALTNAEDELFTVGKDENGRSKFISFHWHEDKNQFIENNNVILDGAGACHISLNNAQNALVVSNYSSGDILTLSRTSKNDTFVAAKQFKNSGKGPTKRQQSPHKHYAQWSRSDQFLFAVDLGTDEVLVFDGQHSELKPIQRIKMAPGAGPRHLTIHPTEPWLYVINELNSSISLIKQSDNSNRFTLDNTLAITHLDEKENNTASAIRISEDGQYLYTAVRGTNKLITLKVLPNGNLKQLQSIPTHGDHPRDFNLSNDEKYLLVANQRSNSISVYERSNNTGLLSYMFSQTGFTIPSHIVPIRGSNRNK